MSPKSNNSSQSFAEILEAFEKKQSDQGSLRKGELVDASVVDISSDRVYIDFEPHQTKAEAFVPIKEFSDPPEIGSQLSVVIKGKEDENDAFLWICSKLEADKRKGWEILKEAFQQEQYVSGKIESEEKGKGFNVNIEGAMVFLPASQIKKKYVENYKDKYLNFAILKLNEKSKSAVISHKLYEEKIDQSKWDALVDSIQAGDKVVAKVTKIANFGVFCEVKGIEGLLRQNDISYKKYAPFKHYFQVGNEVEVLILEIDKEGKRLSLGIKQMFEDPWVWAGRELEKDMVVRGIVTSLTNFGAFVELKEGLEGLIHTSELSWSKKPPHPKDILKKGQEVDSMVLDIDLERKRLSLGLKQLLPNPWDNLGDEIRKGTIREGKVTGITKYGVFVEVENGIEGLIHIGDITWNEKAKDPVSEAGLKKGQSIKYIILDVNKDTQRISLGLKQLQDNPYDLLRKKYPSGVIVEGKIKSIVTFGIFVEIEPGYEGLVHISQIPNGKDIKLEETYKVGDDIKAVLLKIEPENKKISLSIKDFDKAIEKEEMARYIKQDDSPSSESIGSFINLQQKN
ncbi:MAG: 30S ribosomal protein S1 [Leptospiraceae bacterium]|nr:30S ribosomal protein S1 [Leptospiraceae bacterium]